MNNIWLLLLGMGAVTYIPRMLPMIFLQNIKPSPFLKRVLEFIPVAALSALIFPGIIYSTDSIASAITGGIIALLLAWLEVDLLVVVSGGIGGVLLIELLL
ncbi:branched-chain amino acid transporter [Orenia metallireducens]|uniref:Branched-chain amino acid transporter n=1 Tax=Orenia metallireducens TaxID=1413210 RepID=A0A1C0A923_9FIRM|nr:AzlD domain-containing protein [Orenia metallireducens]OCL26759.1 branched-chain amino acid transporter [Orenia metallireducens]